jgi:hypothetical protein
VDKDVSFEDMTPSRETLKKVVNALSKQGALPAEDLQQIAVSQGYSMSVYSPSDPISKEKCAVLSLFTDDNTSAVCMVLNSVGLRHFAKVFSEHALLLETSATAH